MLCGDSLNTAFRPEALADFCDFCFASVERMPIRMNRIHAKHEVEGMPGSRTEDEASVFNGFKFDGTVRLFEHRELAFVDDRRRGQLSLMQGQPGNCVIGRRLVTPFLAPL